MRQGRLCSCMLVLKTFGATGTRKVWGFFISDKRKTPSPNPSLFHNKNYWGLGENPVIAPISWSFKPFSVNLPPLICSVAICDFVIIMSKITGGKNHWSSVLSLKLQTIFLKGWCPDDVILSNCLGLEQVLCPLAELDCRWHLWTLKKGHPLHSWAVSISPYKMGTQRQVWHTSVCWISSAQEKCTTFCWSWHVEINWLLCWAWPVENPFRHHISTWHLPVLIVCSSLCLRTAGILSNSILPAWRTSEYFLALF